MILILNNWIFLTIRLTLESLCTSTNSFLRTDRYCAVPHPDRYLNITEASSSPPHISWNFFIVMIQDEFHWLSDRCLTTSAALSYIWRNRNVIRGIELKASNIPKQSKSWPKSCKHNSLAGTGIAWKKTWTVADTRYHTPWKWTDVRNPYAVELLNNLRCIQLKYQKFIR